MNKWVKRIILIIILGLFSFKVYTVIKLEGVEDEVYQDIPTDNVCIAINYHRVRDKTLWDTVLEQTMYPDELIKYTVYTDEFERQIDKLIEEGAYFATLEEVNKFREEGKFPEKCVYISFDDADKTTYDYAYPILKEKGIPFTIFVIAGQVDTNDFNNIRMTDWDELREMRDSGLVSFGSHTYDMHYLEGDKAMFLNEDNYEEILDDFKLSKETLENELEVKVTSIAYPFGDASDMVVELVTEAGFETGYILAPHPITTEDDPYYQNRYMIHRKNFYEIVVPWLEKF